MSSDLFRNVCLSQCLVVAGLTSVAAADEPSPAGDEGLRVAVQSELGDVARALRGLDQSYAFRGMQGCGSATAGSVSIDWVARGIAPEDRLHPLPPQPLVLSEAKVPCATPPLPVAPLQVAPPVMHPAPVLPVLPQPIPQALPVAPPAHPVHPAPAVGQPCPACDTTAAPLPVVSQPVLSQSIISQPAAGYSYGYDVSYSNGHGRTPPNVMLVNGVWVESPSSSAGCGLAPIYYGRSSGRVW